MGIAEMVIISVVSALIVEVIKAFIRWIWNRFFK